MSSGLRTVSGSLKVIEAGQHLQLEKLQAVENLLSSAIGVTGGDVVQRALREALDALSAGAVQCVALLSLNLRGFEQVRDQLGRRRTALLLQQVTRKLANATVMKAQVARIDGDEFTILIAKAASEDEVNRLALLLAKSIHGFFQVEDIGLALQPSIGVAIAPADGTTPEALQRKADLALTEASQSYEPYELVPPVRYSPSLDQAREERQLLERDLQVALERNEFRLFYQPIVALPSQQVMGFEALIRWEHAERGFVSPAEFVPIAEEIGLISELSNWLLREAIMTCASWPQDIRVAVNLSPVAFNGGLSFGSLLEMLADTNLQPSRLELEVTESVFLTDSESTLDFLRKVRRHGIRVVLDDFGTGYSSLGYLNRAIFNGLKIDGSFIRGARARQDSNSILDAIRSLTRSLEIDLVAEGLETKGDLQRVMALGCEGAQGYLFGRPIPPARVTDLLNGDMQAVAPTSA